MLIYILWKDLHQLEQFIQYQSLYCRVIENDFNRNISILEVIEYCPERGKNMKLTLKYYIPVLV